MSSGLGGDEYLASTRSSDSANFIQGSSLMDTDYIRQGPGLGIFVPSLSYLSLESFLSFGPLSPD